MSEHTGSVQFSLTQSCSVKLFETLCKYIIERLLHPFSNLLVIIRKIDRRTDTETCVFIGDWRDYDLTDASKGRVPRLQMVFPSNWRVVHY